MTDFETYLMSLGYKRYRKEYVNKKWKYILVNDFNSNYSIMVSGGIDYRYMLNEDQETEIVFGLNEVGRPPTLICPRPYNIYSDDDMNRLLKDKTPKEICDLIL